MEQVFSTYKIDKSQVSNDTTHIQFDGRALKLLRLNQVIYLANDRNYPGTIIGITSYGHNLDENSPTIRHPKGLKVKLRPHQLTSIYAMRDLEKQGNIIIDRPDITSGLYQTVRYKLNDTEDFTNSTYVIRIAELWLIRIAYTGRRRPRTAGLRQRRVHDSRNFSPPRRGWRNRHLYRALLRRLP